MGRWAMLVVLMLGGCDRHDDPASAAASATIVLPPLPPLPPLDSAEPVAQAAADGGASCGSKGLLDCPLQAWMKTNMNPPMKAKDYQGLADALERAATLAPPGYQKSGYGNWVSIAKDGAQAARAAELEAVKAACRGCHEQYKNKYRREMRSRPLP